MKIIGSVKEDLAREKRICITPETAKKLAELNFIVFLEKGYGEHLGIEDEEYKNKGANLYSSAKETLEKSEIILKVACPYNEEINLSPQTALNDISNYHKTMLSKVGAIIEGDGIVEISPLLSYAGENLSSYSGKVLKTPIYLE